MRKCREAVASDDPINLCASQPPKEGLGRKVLLFVKGPNLGQKCPAGGVLNSK